MNSEQLLDFAHVAFLPKIDNMGTRQYYAQALDRFFRWHDAYNDPQDVKFDRSVIESYLKAEDTQKLSASSRNGTLCALRGLAAALHKSGSITRETQFLISDIKLERQHNIKSGTLTPEQMQRLINSPDESLHGLRDRAVLAICMGCGLRRAEVANLKVGDMKQKEGGKWVFDVRGKPNGKSWEAFIALDVKRIIDAWLKMRSRDYECGFETRDLYLICPVLQGGILVERRLSTCTIYDIVREYGNKVGIPTLAPHDLRRTYARMMKDKRVKLEQIQAQLGHDSLKSTETYFGEPDLSYGKCLGDLLTIDWMGGKDK